jgi:2-dehydro-3-deoxyphosphogluconate aldolase/(4S)-4-hydroxy-2-oxoglutarate aldolase
MVRAGRDADVPVIPGALTPTEIVQAWEAVASMVKLFPANVVGPRYVKDLQGPLPHIPLLPTGGVTLDGIAAFIRAGAAAVGVGGEIVSAERLARRAFPEITARARAFVEAVKSARERPVPPAPPIKPIEGPDTR